MELHFVREGMILGKGASSSDILRWDFSVMGAKAYVLNLSENVKRSLEFKFRNGEWGGKAPLGYLNARDENGRAILVEDPERSFLVRMLFEEFATGTRSISGDLVRQAKEWGLVNKTRKAGSLTASQIQHILRNPFYYGEMKVKGHLRPHVYPALISKQLFDQCQDVAGKRSRATAIRYSEKPFVFRGLMRCAISGRAVSSDLKKGRHVYLICRDPDLPSRKLFIPEQEVLEQIMAVFRSIRVPADLLPVLLAHLKAGHDAENDFHRSSVQRLRKEHDQTRQRLATLLDLRLDQSITSDEYDKKARKLKERQAALALQIEYHQNGDEGFRTTLEALISLASRAADLLAGSKAEEKRQLIGFVFSNLTLRGRKLEFSLRSPFDLMVDRRGYQGWLGD